METESEGEDCGGSQPARNLDPLSHLQPDTDDKASDPSVTEASVDDRKEIRASGLKTLFGCSVCGKSFTK